MKKIAILFIITSLLLNTIILVANGQSINLVPTVKGSNDISQMISDVKEENVRNYLTELVNNYPNRVVGSKNCIGARNYIYNNLISNSNLNVKIENWTMFGNIYNLRFFSGANVLAELPGTSENPSVIIFLSHHDSSKNSPGADDDGSGVAALLTVASVMSKYKFNNTILFCSSEGEEKGLLGDYYHARWSYQHNINISAAITADAVGYNGENNTGPNSVLLYKPERSNWISDLVLDVNSTYNSEIGLSEVAPQGNFYRSSSGDGAYEDYGYYNLKFFEGVTDPGWEQPPYNNDTIDKINFSYLTNVTKLIVASLATLADMQDLEPKVNIIYPKEDTRYIHGRAGIIPLTKGETRVRGSIKVKAEVKATVGINYINFSLLKDYNENAPQWGNRQVLTWNITSEPSHDFTYEWTIDYNIKYLGKNTIRVTAYDKNNNYKSDEIEVKFGLSFIWL